MSIPGNELKSGWGVVCVQPWHLAGVFTSSIDAETLAGNMGPRYVVKYGDHRVDSEDFITVESNA